MQMQGVVEEIWERAERVFRVRTLRLDLICGTCIFWCFVCLTALVAHYISRIHLSCSSARLAVLQFAVRVRLDGILVIVCNPSELRSQLIKLFVTLHLLTQTHVSLLLDMHFVTRRVPEWPINYWVSARCLSLSASHKSHGTIFQFPGSHNAPSECG